MTTMQKQKAVNALERRLGFPQDGLFNCMLVETGGTLSTSIKNPNSSATGLIQFMEATATALGTSTAKLAQMSFEDQLTYVERYFLKYNYAAKIKATNDDLDIYSGIFYPAMIGKPDSFVISRVGSDVYRSNLGVDMNKDGVLTKTDVRQFFYSHVNSLRKQVGLGALKIDPLTGHSIPPGNKYVLPLVLAAAVVLYSIT